mmetsp:Transcript_44702/g.91256  ORF Transcript_44702/g.91256 Transcript_44702/m.91256 type:complete len:88 (-) Transcript_44702:501-764(-)
MCCRLLWSGSLFYCYPALPEGEVHYKGTWIILRRARQDREEDTFFGCCGTTFSPSQYVLAHLYMFCTSGTGNCKIGRQSMHSSRCNL